MMFGCADTSGIKNEVIESPINLSHALSLIDSMVVEDEMIAYIWIYCDAPDYELLFEEQLGNESLIYIKVGEQNLVARVTQDEPGPNNGNNKLSLNLKKACFFDPKTGNQIINLNTD